MLKNLLAQDRKARAARMKAIARSGAVLQRGGETAEQTAASARRPFALGRVAREIGLQRLVVAQFAARL